MTIKLSGINRKQRTQRAIELYQKGYSYKQVAEIIGMSKSGIQYIIQNNNIPIRTISDYDQRKYFIKDDFFKSLDSELSSYWLGYLMADGYVSENKNEIILTSKDKITIENFQKDLNTNYPITIKQSKYYSIVIISKLIKKDLIRIGCTPRKTFTLQFPCVPMKVINHFIRGYFDGDGSIWYDSQVNSLRSEFLGTYNFLLEIKNQINLNSKANILPKGNIYRYSVSGNNLNTTLKQYLYKDATRYLERKKERFEKYL